MTQLQSQSQLQFKGMLDEVREMIHTTQLINKKTRAFLDDLSIPYKVWDILIFLYEIVYPRFSSDMDMVQKKTKFPFRQCWLAKQGFKISSSSPLRTRISAGSRRAPDESFWAKLGIPLNVRCSLRFNSNRSKEALHSLNEKQRLYWFCLFHRTITRMTYKSEFFKEKIILQIFASAMIKLQVVAQCTYNQYVKRLNHELLILPRDVVLLIADYF